MFKFCRLLGELVAQLDIIQRLHTLEEGIEFQLLFIEAKLFSGLFLQLRLWITKEGKFR